jgi:pyruvate,orthophosphate dikinase
MTTDMHHEISPKYEVLRDVVKDYPGILSASEPLFRELNNHPFNWDAVVKEMRAYAFKNFYLHDHHEKGTAAIEAVIGVFLEGVNNPDISVREAAAESLIFYLEKIMVDGNSDLEKYRPVLRDCFIRLNRLEDEHFFIFVTNPHQLKKLGQIILGKMPAGLDIGIFNDLLFRYLSLTFDYWLNEEDPVKRLKEMKDIALTDEQSKKLQQLFYPVSHDHLRELSEHMRKVDKSEDQYSRLRELIKLPGYMQLVKFYEELSGMLTVTGDSHTDMVLKSRYLLKIMEIAGLSGIHENILREINRAISDMIKTEEPDRIKSILADTVGALKESFERYPETVLYCIQSIGNEVYNRGDSGFADWYLQKIILLGFQYPDIRGVTEDWQVRSSRTHLKNVRVWLELIENNPKWSKALLSALIINLRLCGVHISDTDIFQKDITRLLNSDIRPVYNLVKQMARLFPVYFSEIGAEGPLREVSTEIDESTRRADVLVHFLRKQSHVESSARVVDFIEEVISFWRTKDKTGLKNFIPEEVYEQVKDSGPFVDELHTIFDGIFRLKGFSETADLLSLSQEEVHTLTGDMPPASDREKKRAELAIRFYHLLNKKYKLDPQDIRAQLKFARCLGLPGTDSLIAVLEGGSVSERLEGVLNYLDLLRDIILSPERHEPVENIFRKRHIAAGIPSVYGKYHELKFDALTLTFRLEGLANILFEDLINSINMKFITRATLFQIEKYAGLFFKALELDGISSYKLENALDLLSVALEVRRFSFSQYIDIFRGFSDAVQDILNSYYSGIFKNNLKQIIPQIGAEHILPKYLQTGKRRSEAEFVNTVSEQFLRETVATSFGLQQLDNFISRILKTLFEQAESLDVQNLDLLMSYDPKKALSGIHTPNNVTRDRIHLGNKGYNLIKLGALGIPVPPGFIITTEVFRCENAINRFRYVREHLDEGIEQRLWALEKQTGKVFGEPENPLIVSVRSGGAISMPGMMISFLNVGINESIVNGLIKRTAKPWFAWDCYRRFLQCWGMSYGMERDKFDDIMNFFKDKYDVLRKIQFMPDQMRDVALGYRQAIRDSGIEIIDDPRAQLQASIEQVFKSWFSKKAQAYREILGISENWGTAVIVQAMACGNLDINSGTGVLFTRNPQESGDRVMLWGDFAIGAQGEDIVSGLVKTLPISNEQRPYEDRTSEISFEESFPEIYDALLRISKDLMYKEQWGAQEIEFTFEGKNSANLYILQTRDMALTREESFMAFVPSKKLTASYLSRGLGVGGGALSGRVVFDLDDIEELRQQYPATPLILVRSDTVPDDIRHISAADGLLTARGGSTSHASIIANRLGKTCVVGCSSLAVWEHEKRCRINKRSIKVGDFLSIDGRNGSVYSGKHQAKEIKAAETAIKP